MRISLKVTLGLDVSDHFSSYCLLAADGEVEQQGRVRTTPSALRSFFEGRKLRVVVEAGPPNTVAKRPRFILGSSALARPWSGLGPPW